MSDPASERPLVSVIVPAFRAENSIGRTLDSIARQTYAPLEVVVVDDCSPDRTADIAAAWTKCALTVVRHPENRGPGAARNTGIRAASGEFVAFLDADDEWLETKIEKQIAALAAAEAPPGAAAGDIALVSCDGVWFSPEGAEIGTVYEGTPPVQGPDAWKTMLAYSFVSTPCVLARRRQVIDVGLFDENLLIAQDQDMWIRLAMAGGVLAMPDKLVRIHTSADSHIQKNSLRELEYLWPMIRRHMAARRGDLTARDRRFIVGRRLLAIGANLAARGRPRAALRPLFTALFRGRRPRALWVLLLMLPPAQWALALRRALLRRERR